MLQFSTLYQDANILIEESSAEQYLRIVWLKHANTEQFKEIAHQITKITRGRRIRLLLSDSREILFLDMAAQNFLLQHVYPNISGSGKFFIAYVVSPASYDMMDIYRVGNQLRNSTELKDRVITKIFLGLEDAQDWILEEGRAFEEEELYPSGSSTA